VYIGAERVDDVTAHPAFREGARTIAAIYDRKADPAHRDLFSFEEDGERIRSNGCAAARATTSCAACAR
jgi:4-hydroxyphenylacetate 3-monooxygenase